MTEPRVYFCDACGKNIGKRQLPFKVPCSRCGHVNERLTTRKRRSRITVTK